VTTDRPIRWPAEARRILPVDATLAVGCGTGFGANDPVGTQGSGHQQQYELSVQIREDPERAS
jgi:hypothetical protein